MAKTPCPVLVQGESGTGKELIARRLHRRSGPFIAVNCAAMPRELVESELFGHERGAFTGALGRKPGQFELASGGTLLLDEITEMDIGLQAKLLRAVETGEIHRVGGLHPVPVDVRIVATTNREPRAAIAAGVLRADLYYRVAAAVISLPPLRARYGDVRYLARCFAPGRVGVGALAKLEAHDWPGNVRELQHVLEVATLTSTGMLMPEDLPPLSRQPVPPPVPGEPLPPSTEAILRAELLAPGFQLPAALERIEAFWISEALARHGTQKAAAHCLGINRTTLCEKIKRRHRGQVLHLVRTA